MIKQLAILSTAIFILGCTSSENEQRQRIPDGTYRPSGFHAFISHGEENLPVSLVKADSLYHLFYTTGTDEWGHLSSNDMLTWKADVSFPIETDGYGAVVYDEFNLSGLNAPWIVLLSDGNELSLSYSQDGANWNSYDGNPILSAKGVPSINWSADLESWVLTTSYDDKVSFYTSQNLLEWTSNSSVSIENVTQSSLLNIDGQWILLSFVEGNLYQPMIFDGSSFQINGQPGMLDGLKGKGVILSNEDGLIIISRNQTSNTQLPTFTSPLSIDLIDGELALFPSATFQTQIVGKRRARLSKLLTDGPSWYKFGIENEFQEMEIVISDNTSDLRILWNVSDKKILISGTSLPSSELMEQSINQEINIENLSVDILIDHASVDLFFNNGKFATSILTLPDSFFSRVEVYLDGEIYDAKGVLLDIGI